MRLNYLNILGLIALLAICVEAGKDYYSILGVSRNAGLRQIKKAYREMAQKYHPDKNPGDKVAHEKYVEIAAAYEVLTDQSKKEVYDQYGEEGLQQQQQGGGHHHDPFEMFFGGGRRRGGHQHQETPQGPSIVVPLQVTLEDLYLGKVFTVANRKQTLCSQCAGTGAKNPDDVQVCPTCRGTGTRTIVQQLGPGFIQQTQAPCDKCGGKGKIYKSKCPKCRGSKVEIGEETITIMIEQGMKDGHRITFDNEADEMPDMTAGDLIFEIKELPHKRFTRKGNDLHIKTYITLLQALTGFSKVIKHLDGHSVTLSRDKITTPGFVMEIPGEGMPIHDDVTNGSLFVEFWVRFPAFLSAEQQESLKAVLGK